MPLNVVALLVVALVVEALSVAKFAVVPNKVAIVAVTALNVFVTSVVNEPVPPVMLVTVVEPSVEDPVRLIFAGLNDPDVVRVPDTLRLFVVRPVELAVTAPLPTFKLVAKRLVKKPESAATMPAVKLATVVEPSVVEPATDTLPAKLERPVEVAMNAGPVVVAFTLCITIHVLVANGEQPGSRVSPGRNGPTANAACATP